LVTCNSHTPTDSAHERRDGATNLTCVTVASKFFKNLESDVPRTDMDTFSVSDREIDTADIRSIEVQDAEIVCRYKSL